MVVLVFLVVAIECDFSHTNELSKYIYKYSIMLNEKARRKLSPPTTGEMVQGQKSSNFEGKMCLRSDDQGQVMN